MLWLADTSIAVPALHVSHQAHAQVQRGLAGRGVGLTVHSALETYRWRSRLRRIDRVTAKQVGATLLTRDSRARATYLAVGVEHEILG